MQSLNSEKKTKQFILKEANHTYFKLLVWGFFCYQLLIQTETGKNQNLLKITENFKGTKVKKKYIPILSPCSKAHINSGPIAGNGDFQVR